MRAFDLIVVGGGAGGLAAARAAGLEGARVALVSEGPLGGDCTWTGCVPSKTLIEAAADGATFVEAMARVRSVVDHIASTENDEVLAGEGIEVLRGRAVLTGPNTVQVSGSHEEELHAEQFVLATGASAVVPAIPGLREIDHLTHETLWDLPAAPGRLAVLGGGPIGCELSQALARLGVEVTLFEMADRVLEREDIDASPLVTAALEADGVTVLTGTAVGAVEPNSDGSVVVVAGGRRVEVDRVLVALGRRPNTDGMGLDEVGVERTERGHIRVDARLQTSVGSVRAVGDVNGLLPLTHAADEQGRLAGWAVTGRRGWMFDADQVPRVTFTSPEVAQVGVTEQDAPRNARVAYLPMGENDRAIAAGETEGYIKLIAAPRRLLRNLGGGRLIGATIVGPRAGEMIHEPALLLRTKGFTGRLAQLTHAYPTWSVGIQKCAGQFFQPVEGREARKPATA